MKNKTDFDLAIEKFEKLGYEFPLTGNLIFVKESKKEKEVISFKIEKGMGMVYTGIRQTLDENGKPLETFSKYFTKEEAEAALNFLNYFDITKELEN